MTIEATQPLSVVAESGIEPSPPLPPGRVRRAVMTWGMNFIYTSITILVGFVTTPILLRLLSPERIGASKASGEWIGYLMLADLGMGSAFSVLLLRARKEGLPQTAGVARFGLGILSLVSLIIVPLGLVLAWYMPNLVKIDPQLARELQIAVGISAVGLVLVPLTMFRTILEASQRGYLVNAGLLIQSLIITGLSLLLAWQGWGLIGLSIAGMVGGIIFIILTMIWSIRQVGDLRRAPRAQVTLRELWKLSWPLATAGVAGRLNLMTDSIVVGFLLGPVDVAILFLTQRLIVLSAAQINSLNNATWAALGELMHAGRTDIFEARIAELTRLIVGLGTVLVGTVAAYDAQFVRLWVGGDMYGGDLLAALTVATSVTFGFQILFMWMTDLAGETRLRLHVSLGGAMLNLVLSIIFVRTIGLPGVVLGTLCAYLLSDAWYCPRMVCRRYGVRGRLILTALSRGLLVGLPWAIGAWLLARSHTPPFGWLGFAGEFALVGSAALVYCWWMILTRAERVEWRRRVSSLRGHVDPQHP